jgi:hypothetical protein
MSTPGGARTERHEAGDCRLESCLVVGMAERAGIITAIVCSFLAIQRVA